MKNHEKVLVAIIGKSVALRGEHKLHLKCDFPEQFKPNATFELESGEVIEIERYLPQRSIVKFKNFNNKNDSKRLINQALFTTIDKTRQSCNLKKGEYFWFDMIGALVVENEKVLGTVKEIERIAQYDYLVVKTDEAFRDISKEFYIPYIKEYIIKFDKLSNQVFTKNSFELLKAS